MAGWTKVVPSNTPTWDREDVIEGEYVKAQSEIGPNESNLYTLRTKDGEIGVWGSTTLDTKFADVPLHAQVKIEPLGKVKSEKTGREYLDFDVFYKEPEFKQAGATSGYEQAKRTAEGLKNRTQTDEPLPEYPPGIETDGMPSDFLV